MRVHCISKFRCETKDICARGLRWLNPTLVVRNQSDFSSGRLAKLKFVYLTFVRERLFNSFFLISLRGPDFPAFLSLCLFLNSSSSLNLSFIYSDFNTSRVAHTAKLTFVLHDTKSGFYYPSSNTTFHHLLSTHFPPSQQIPSPSVSPAPSALVPWAAPALCAGSEHSHGRPARVYFKTTDTFLHGYRS